ncbi:MAG: family 16 glycoside hydrolase [Planctomycetota bacterium]
MNLLLTLFLMFQQDGGQFPIRTLIVSGANHHDWEWTTPRLKQMLERSGKFSCEILERPSEQLAAEGALDRIGLIVLDYNGPRWGEAAERAFLAAVQGGTGVTVIHAANNAFPGWVEYEKLVGHCWHDGSGHGGFHPFDVTIVDRNHPITEDLADLRLHPDELHHRLVPMHGTARRTLATALSSKESGGTGEVEPMLLVGSYGSGRVFHTPLGHVLEGGVGVESFQDVRFQDLVVRGSEWAATGEVTSDPAGPNRLSDAEKEGGWELLFDGGSLAGWRGFRQESAPQGWRVEGGSIVVRKGGAGGDLITNDQFGDMELSFEWQVTKGANSGVRTRVSEEYDAPNHSGPEYQVLDDAGHGLDADDLHSAGAIYELAQPRDKVLRTPGGWNRGRIRIEGWVVTHWLNGHQSLSLDLDSPEGRRRIRDSKFSQWPGFAKSARGHIALQDHGDEVRYRSLKVRQL